ncbi:FUSC family protein [Commensalibacter oyaizuii]|uniref:FUSC family protein n=1 Tax=Commensalibacter oyaizuii TaxID=3043873 RepID=A0ABT6Q3M0_9PROT|nr:FUSC family protein [Commensalibacter sp. TBRC 16381]MDI2091730.1 FUSC family protein [Commensalibacter sp. TBRC 16381]
MVVGRSTLESLRWLYAPQKVAIIFAFRTILASYIALLVALWMELDSPRWAMMAVWIVAQNTSRGEVLSKAYWIIFGNITGVIVSLCIVAAFPQQPFLFELSIAFWVAFCCWVSSCTRNFRALGMVMAGYSCAIILFSSVNDPNETFMMAMSRGSYFILGILAENFTARIFDLNLHHHAHKKLNDDLQTAVEESIKSVTKMLDGNDWAVAQSDRLLSSIINLNNNIEFRERELKGTGHRGDHARAVLASVSGLLVKASGFSILMKQIQNQNLNFHHIIPLTKIYLTELLLALRSGEPLEYTLKALNSLRWECRQRIADSFYKTLGEKQFSNEEFATKLLNDRILYQSLREILAELEVALRELEKSRDITLHDHFKFDTKHAFDFKRAWRNAIRAFVAISVGCIAWEVTGWDRGPLFLAFLCMGCARFCIFENATLACMGWFKGACLAILVGGFFNFLILPTISNFEILFVILIVPLAVGGLAMCVPKYAPIASTYAFFFCYILGFSNDGRVDELSYFNNSLAVLMSGVFALASYRLFFPYRARRLRRQMREKLLQGMHHLAETATLPLAREWISFVSESLVVLMRQLNEDRNTTLIQTYRHGSMAVMLIGIHIIRLRSMVDFDIMSKDINDVLRVVLRRISVFDGRRAKYAPHARTVMIAHRAIAKFRQRELYEKNLAVRIEISAAISSLIIIAYALDKNASFLRIKNRHLLAK